jgi:transcriptional regulator EpsA
VSAVHPKEHLIILSEREREYLVRAMESAIHVRQRHQFFLWAQGQFRGVLPHEMLICVRLDGEGRVLQLECFHGTVLDEDAYEKLCNPVRGYAVQIARQCCVTNPLMLSISSITTHGDLALGLKANGLKNALAFATEPIHGGKYVYILLDLAADPGPRDRYFLELLLPHLQMATMRLADVATPDVPALFNAGTRLVTDREVEILRLLQRGGSNHEIATMLGISPLTVKNHVHKICRKLNAQNRAHAVARGISLRVLDSVG